LLARNQLNIELGITEVISSIIIDIIGVAIELRSASMRLLVTSIESELSKPPYPHRDRHFPVRFVAAGHDEGRT